MSLVLNWALRTPDRAAGPDLTALLVEVVGSQVVGDRQSLDGLVGDGRCAVETVYCVGEEVFIDCPVEIAAGAFLGDLALRAVFVHPVVLQPVQIPVAGDAVDLRNQYVDLVRSLGGPAGRGGVRVVERNACFEFVVEFAAAVERYVIFVVVVLGDDTFLVVRREAQTEIVFLVAAGYRDVINIGMSRVIEVLDIVFVGFQLDFVAQEILDGLSFDLGAPAVLRIGIVGAVGRVAACIAVLEIGSFQDVLETQRRVDRYAGFLHPRTFLGRDDDSAVLGAAP